MFLRQFPIKLTLLDKLVGKIARPSGWFAICTDRCGVYFCEVETQATKVKVNSCKFFPLAEVTSDALEILREENNLGKYQFTTLLAPGEYQLSVQEAPNVPAVELKTAMRWRIKDILDYPVDEAVVDVLTVPVGKYGSSQPQSVYAIAARNQVIASRAALFAEADIALSAIDIPELAQRNVAAQFEQEGRALALLAFDHTGGLLTFTAGGELYLARRMEVTVGQLQDANEMVRVQCMERVELELQRSMDYFDRQFSHLMVSQILLAVPEQVGLEQFLVANTGLPVVALDMAQGFDISAVPELADRSFAAHLLLVLGAALRKEGAIA